MKICTRCKQSKPLAQFGKSPRYHGGHRTWCKSCCTETNNEYNKRNIEKFRERKRNYMRSPKAQARQMLRKYGLTQADWADIISAQGGICAICKIKPSRLVPDHDHQTGVIRGALCWACNTGLGQFGDDLYLLNQATVYLAMAAR